MLFCNPKNVRPIKNEAKRPLYEEQEHAVFFNDVCQHKRVQHQSKQLNFEEEEKNMLLHLMRGGVKMTEDLAIIIIKEDLELKKRFYLVFVESPPHSRT